MRSRDCVETIYKIQLLQIPKLMREIKRQFGKKPMKGVKHETFLSTTEKPG